MDVDALAALGGRPTRQPRPVSLRYLLRVGIAAAVAAAVCNVLLWVTARRQGWSMVVDGLSVEALAVVLVSVIAGVLGAIGTYAAARTTRRPALWTAIVGLVVLLASLVGLPPTLSAMHVITGAWVIGWLVAAVRGAGHER